MLDNLIAALILSSCVLAAQNFVSVAWVRYQRTHRIFELHLTNLQLARIRRDCVEVTTLTHSYVASCRAEKERAILVLNRD